MIVDLRLILTFRLTSSIDTPLIEIYLPHVRLSGYLMCDYEPDYEIMPPIDDIRRSRYANGPPDANYAYLRNYLSKLELPH